MYLLFSLNSKCRSLIYCILILLIFICLFNLFLDYPLYLLK